MKSCSANRIAGIYKLEKYLRSQTTTTMHRGLSTALLHKTVMQAHITQILEEQPATIAQLDSYVKRVHYRNQQIVMLDIIVLHKRHQW